MATTLYLAQPANTALGYCTFKCTFDYRSPQFSTALRTGLNWMFDRSSLMSIASSTDYESAALTN